LATPARSITRSMPTAWMLLGGTVLATGAVTAFALARLAAPAERSELFAVAYVIAYLALSLPAVIAGVASTSVGLRTTAMAYGVAVGALGLTALAVQRGRAAHQRRPAPATQPQSSQVPQVPQVPQSQQRQAAGQRVDTRVLSGADGAARGRARR
jgi:hypothetical protein